METKKLRNAYYVHAADIGFIKTTREQMEYLQRLNKISLWCKEPSTTDRLLMHYYVKKDDPVLKFPNNKLTLKN